MTIAIIGGAGFVGTRLVSRIAASAIEYSIFDIDQSKLLENMIYLDVEDPESLDKIRCNFYHQFSGLGLGVH